MTHLTGYQLIKRYYGKARAKRSGVRLINHVDEGVKLLQYMKAEQEAIEAFCIHPMIQADKDLENKYGLILHLGSIVVMYAMEYRNIANGHLSPRDVRTITEIKISPLPHVNLMLIADKIQNFKDFRRFHHGSHPNTDRLERYFQDWFIALGLTHENVVELLGVIDGNVVSRRFGS